MAKAAWAELKRETEREGRKVWGIRVEAPGVKKEQLPGALVEVTRKDGTTSNEKITEVVWADDGEGVFLCKVEAKPKEAKPKSPFKKL